MNNDSAVARLSLLVKGLDEMLKAEKITIKAMGGESILITDQDTKEEYVVEDLGYPF